MKNLIARLIMTILSLLTLPFLIFALCIVSALTDYNFKQIIKDFREDFTF